MSVLAESRLPSINLTHGRPSSSEIARDTTDVDVHGGSLQRLVTMMPEKALALKKS